MKGLGVSPGFGYAKALVLDERPIIIPEDKNSIEEESNAFEEALKHVYEETLALKDKALVEAGKDAADIFDAHCHMITDEGMNNGVREEISKGMSAAKAVDKILSEFIDIFENMENEYISLRALDIKDIRERLIRRILNIEIENISDLKEPVIIVANDITPSTTAALDFKNVEGLLMEYGGSTSHTAILARTLEIPAVVGVNDLMDNIHSGEYIAIAGDTGEVSKDMSDEELKIFLQNKKDYEERKAMLQKLSYKEAVTKDGKSVELYGNIRSPEDTEKVLEKGGNGIGLFRSEFLYLAGNQLPSEEDQYEAYKEVLELMGDRPVIIRTLDIGGDKDVPALNLKKEDNPFLGLRAIRLCRKNEEIFRTQIRALLRASIYGNLEIMFPMISSLDELRWSKEFLNKCKVELIEEGISVKENIPVGIMIEIPSTAVMADLFAKECDFFSIGTNDLTQYLLAVDRGNEEISYLYSNYHPALLHLIKKTIDGAHSAGIPCGMCGEAAGNLKLIPFLMGLGLDEFSMIAPSILEAKELIINLSQTECEELVEKVLSVSTAMEVEGILQQFSEKRREKIC